MRADQHLPDLPPALAREAYAELCGSLPAPPADTPDARAAREDAAMAAVAALHPADAFEARLAVRIVAMEAHAADALRSASLAAADPDAQHRCRSQAASMARQADGGLRALLRIQATREKQLAQGHPAAMQRAGYWFREITVPEAAPSAEPPVPPPVSAPLAAAVPASAAPAPVDSEFEARRYAALYPDRTARIRAAGGLPAKLDFGPPDPAIVAALIADAAHLDRARAA